MEYNKEYLRLDNDDKELLSLYAVQQTSHFAPIDKTRNTQSADKEQNGATTM